MTVRLRLCLGFRSCAIVLAVLLAGCGQDGPALTEVEGTVTLDGNPLSGATVVFRPEQGRSSVGETDEAGHYKLKYTNEKMGALPGKHKVSITTYRSEDADAGTEGQPERIPAKYNEKSTLEAEVPEDDSATLDFALDSQGEVLQPGQDASGGRSRSTD